jgi:hypothetical protein
MTEPVVRNETAFHASLLPIVDRDGNRCRLALVKATYNILPQGGVLLAETQREARLGDEPWGAPELPDIRLPGDFYAAKPGTDFVLAGHAVPPPGSARRHVDVQLRVAERTMRLRVHGKRFWISALGSVVPGPSEPLRPTPLAWSHAYGGLDLTDPSHPLEESRNPVGSGVARDATALLDMPAPQIEIPGEPVQGANCAATPGGCAPLGRTFSPRRELAGTYESDYMDRIYPARPADYREEHEHFAPAEFVFQDPLRGGEAVELSGVYDGGALGFLIPKWRLLIEAHIDDELISCRPHLDSVVTDTDALQVELVWRALFPCPPKMAKRVAYVRVRAKEFEN